MRFLSNRETFSFLDDWGFLKKVNVDSEKSKCRFRSQNCNIHEHHVMKGGPTPYKTEFFTFYDLSFKDLISLSTSTELEETSTSHLLKGGIVKFLCFEIWLVTGWRIA